MNQLDLFDNPQRHPQFHGPMEDGDEGAFQNQQRLVFDLMKDGVARTKYEIASKLDIDESSAAARLRCFRQERFKKAYGVKDVDRISIGKRQYKYRLVME